MSLFGMFFTSFNIIAKGITEIQYSLETKQNRERAIKKGFDTYYDHNGVMHDVKTKKTIVYHVDPFTGHRVVQDGNTYETIKDVTEEKYEERRLVNKNEAIQKGNKYYIYDSPKEVFGLSECTKLEYKYNWSCKGDVIINEFWKSWKDGKRPFEVSFKSGYGSLFSTFIYSSVSDKNTKLIKEKYSHLYSVMTDLRTGLAIDVDDETRERLTKEGRTPDQLIECINEAKKKYVNDSANKKMPICINY